MARRKAAGQRLGRKKGGKNVKYKLDDKEKLIRSMLSQGCSKASICRKLKCNAKTLDNQLKRMKNYIILSIGSQSKEKQNNYITRI